MRIIYKKLQHGCRTGGEWTETVLSKWVPPCRSLLMSRDVWEIPFQRATHNWISKSRPRAWLIIHSHKRTFSKQKAFTVLGSQNVFSLKRTEGLKPYSKTLFDNVRRIYERYFYVKCCTGNGNTVWMNNLYDINYD